MEMGHNEANAQAEPEAPIIDSLTIFSELEAKMFFSCLMVLQRYLHYYLVQTVRKHLVILKDCWGRVRNNQTMLEIN